MRTGELFAFRFDRTLPALHGNLFATRKGEYPGGCVLGDGTAGADRAALADRNRCHQLRIRTDEYTILDDGSVFVRTVVVAGNGSCADVYIAPDTAVADIRQVVGLGTIAKL